MKAFFAPLTWHGSCPGSVVVRAHAPSSIPCLVQTNTTVISRKARYCLAILHNISFTTIFYQPLVPYSLSLYHPSVLFFIYPHLPTLFFLSLLCSVESTSSTTKNQLVAIDFQRNSRTISLLFSHIISPHVSGLFLDPCFEHSLFVFGLSSTTPFLGQVLRTFGLSQ